MLESFWKILFFFMLEYRMQLEKVNNLKLGIKVINYIKLY
jgi:hypothetical protein